MNHDHFGSVGMSACSLETPGTSPPDSMADMITSYTYDPGNRLTVVSKSTGTYSSPSSIPYETLTYTQNNHVEYLVDANACVLGTPEECVAACREYEAAGVDLLLCLVNPYNISHEAVMQTIELMGTEVIPHFAD